VAVATTDAERDRLLLEGAAAYRRYVSAEVLHGHATAEAAGLNATDFFCLNLLSLSGPLTAGQLAQQTGLTTGAATRMIDRLERAGFVRRGRDAADRRQVIVEVCPAAGHDEIGAALEPARRRMREVFQRYTAQEARVLIDYFTRAAPALLAAAEDLRDRPARHSEPPGQPPPGNEAGPRQRSTTPDAHMKAHLQSGHSKPR
jgi:DNA-binding MarR family transcriptional regulator